MKSTLPMAWQRALTVAMAASLLVALATTLTACGGSDGTDTTLAPPEDASPVRFLSTTGFRAGSLLLLLSFGGGLTDGFHQFDPSKPALPSVYDGMFITRQIPGAKDTDPTVGIDYNFEQGSARPATLALTPPKPFGITLGTLNTAVYASGEPILTTGGAASRGWCASNTAGVGRTRV